MISHENRVIGGAFVLLVSAVFAVGAIEHYVGIPLSRQPLFVFSLFVGLTFALPQLVLAATDDDLSPRRRVRFTVIVIGLFAFAFAGETQFQSGIGPGLLEVDFEALQNALILAVGAGSFLTLVCYEFLAGYRATAVDEPTPR